MAESPRQASQSDKLFATIRFAIIVSVIGAGLYFFGPSLLQKWNEFQGADEKTKEAERRQKLAGDALARVQDNGQQILNAAFPLAIGPVPFKHAKLEGLASMADGYQATVKIHYTNILKDDYFMEILVTYDTMGGFRNWRIGHCNDRFPPKILDKIFDGWMK